MSNIRNTSIRVLWVQAFMSTVQTGSMTVTSRRLGVDRSMVSRYLKELTIYLGEVPLFENNELTEHEQLFYPILAQIHFQLERLEECICSYTPPT